MQLDIFEEAVLKYDNFQIPPKKHPNKAFLFFRKILQLGKFESADLKYDNFFFEILLQKYLFKTFWVRNLGIFLISQNFAVRQNQRC